MLTESRKKRKIERIFRPLVDFFMLAGNTTGDAKFTYGSF